MKMKKMIMAAVASLAFFGMSTSAFAVWTSAGGVTSLTGPTATAFELTPGVKAATPSVASVVFRIGAGQNLPGPAVAGGATSTITVALTGGAVFVNVPGAPSAFVGTAVTPTPGLASYTFPVLTVGGGLIPGDLLTFTIGQLDMSAVPLNGVVDVVVSATTAAGVVAIPPTPLSAALDGVTATSTFGPIATVVPELTAVVTPSVDVATAASAFQGLGAVIPAAPVPATAFTITLSSATASSGFGGPVPITGDNFVVSLAGSMAGIASFTTAAAVTGSTAAGVATVPAAPGTFTIDAAGLTANAILTAPIPAAGLPIVVTPTWDGVTAQTARVFTASVTPFVPAAGVSAFGVPLTPVAPTTAYSIVRNGSNFTLNRIAPISSLLISDHSGAAVVNAAITYQGFDTNGVALVAAGALPAILAPNATVAVTGAQLIAAFGPTLRSVRITVESADVLITHRQGSARGILMTAGATATTTGRTGL